MEWLSAPDIEKDVRSLITSLELDYLKKERIFCFRSYGSSSRARARIWSFPRIWQQALVTPPAYCIEVIAEKFDRLDLLEKRRTLVHELLHIPKNFSGSLLPHRRQAGKSFDKRVELLFRQVLEKEKQ